MREEYHGKQPCVRKLGDMNDQLHFITTDVHVLELHVSIRQAISLRVRKICLYNVIILRAYSTERVPNGGRVLKGDAM